jgi:SRSO17 transposase
LDADWTDDLERWLAPFLSALGHKTRRRMCPAYIAGLIGPGDRKSVQPMAARAGEVGYDQLHHFVAAGVWDSAPLEAALLAEADRLVGDEAGFLVIDDTALPKKGRHSVGVAPQYASSLGKTANCQSMVSVTLASREVPVMVGLRLFLPESWTDDPERMTRSGVPQDCQVARTKPEIAIQEIDRVIASGARFGCVLADSGYGSSGAFRQALSERGLLWAVGLSRRQNVYPADVDLIFPVAKSGRRRQYHIPDQRPISAEAMLADKNWRKVKWR